MENEIILMTPLPPPAGGICRWAEMYLNSLNNRGIKFQIVDEGRGKNSFVFGKGSKTSFLNQLKRNKRIWRDLKIALDKNNCKKIPPIKIANLAYKIVNKKKPRYVYNINRNPLLLILNFLPQRFQNWVIKKILISK